MSSDRSSDRTGPPRPSWAGKKRTAPDEFTDAEHVKRRQHKKIPRGPGSDRNTIHSDRTRFVESESPTLANPPSVANAVRRFSFNDGSRQKKFSPVTRSGTDWTSPVVENTLHSDDSMFPNASLTSKSL